KKSGLFEFWRRFGSIADHFGYALSPKPCQNSKILASNGHRISLIALAELQDWKESSTSLRRI
ncbi:MAG TPA: hypothetical protein VGO67_08235, partial [Verrucomicrobiae bacterium]